jgi:hypothetical protein
MVKVHIMPYPINTPSHNQICSNNFSKQSTKLGQAKKQGINLSTARSDQMAYATVNYTPSNNAHDDLGYGISHVANNHQYGQSMTRYAAHDLNSVNKPSKLRTTTEVLVQSIKERRHIEEHPEMLQHVIQATQSKNPQKLNALLNNPGFLHMCLNDARILPNFKAVIEANMHESFLGANKSPSDLAAIHNLQRFCNMSQSELSSMLQQGSKKFDHYMAGKMNKASAISTVNHVAKAGIGFIPYAGPAAVAGFTAVQIAETAHNYTRINQLTNPQYNAMLAGAASTGITGGIMQEASQQGALHLGKAFGSEAAATTAEFALGTALPGASSAVRLGIGLPSVAVSRFGAAKFYHDNKFNIHNPS